MSPELPTANEVGALYDIGGVLIDRVWDENFHYGLWESPEDPADVPTATARFTDLMLELMEPPAGVHILDVGCGSGKPATYIGARWDVELTGITLSAVEVERAGRRAAAEGLADRVRFELADAMALPFPNRAFGAGMALQSMMHMPDRGDALRELGRVIAPGGRLVLSDFYAAAPLGARGSEAVAAYCELLRLNAELLDLGSYETLLDAAGFTLTRALELPDERSKRRSLELFADGVDAVREEYLDTIGPELLDRMAEICRAFAATPEVGLLVLAGERR